MDFEGKNILLYSLGSIEPQSEPTEVIPHICQGSAEPQHWWKLSNNEQIKGRRCGCGEDHEDKKKREQGARERKSERKTVSRPMRREEFLDGLSEIMTEAEAEAEKTADVT